MGEPKFTPGPWEVSKYKPNLGQYEIESEDYHFWLAYVGAPDEDKETAKANAHLIAAAPELYEALKAIMSELPQRRDWLDPALEQAAMEALAKAEGKTK